jgi:tripeptide aminopeptidase
MNYERMQKIFLRLLETESPYGCEKAAANVVCAFLDRQGIAWTDDGSAVKTGSDIGNIIVAGPGDARLSFNAHMDTIRIFERKKPIVDGTMVKAEGGGILGIDDMSGMAAVLELAASLHENGGIPSGIHCTFTVSEERGFRGAWALDERHFKNAFNFVVDSGGVPVVRVVRRGIGEITFTVTVHGTMGHASLQGGKNAAVLAAKLITLLKPGKAKTDSFIHIGSIECPGNPNTTPDRCVFDGQIMFFDKNEGNDIAGEMKAAVEQFAAEGNCKVDFNTVNDCAPWYVPDDDPIILYAREAAKKTRLPFALSETRSGSDAQVISERGGKVIKISTGMMKLHSKEEYIDLNDLNRCADYLWQLATVPGCGS